MTEKSEAYQTGQKLGQGHLVQAATETDRILKGDDEQAKEDHKQGFKKGTIQRILKKV